VSLRFVLKRRINHLKKIFTRFEHKFIHNAFGRNKRSGVSV